LYAERLGEESLQFLFLIIRSMGDTVTGDEGRSIYLDALGGSRMRIQERYVHAGTGSFEFSKAFKHSVQ
jgi:hypothetical protein